MSKEQWPQGVVEEEGMLRRDGGNGLTLYLEKQIFNPVVHVDKTEDCTFHFRAVTYPSAQIAVLAFGTWDGTGEDAPLNWVRDCWYGKPTRRRPDGDPAKEYCEEYLEEDQAAIFAGTLDGREVRLMYLAMWAEPDRARTIRRAWFVAKGWDMTDVLAQK